MTERSDIPPEDQEPDADTSAEEDAEDALQQAQQNDDDEALEVLLSRPGNAAYERTPVSMPAPSQQNNEQQQNIDEEEAEEEIDGEALLESGVVEEAVDAAQFDPLDEDTQEPQVPAVAEVEAAHAVDADADTGEHQQTPTMHPSASVEGEAQPDLTNPEVDQFENAGTAPIRTVAPQPPRPAQPVPIPVPLPALNQTQTSQHQVPPLPPAPLSPPPVEQSLASMPLGYSMQQRINAYAQGGYRMQGYFQNEAIMTYGKPLSFGWWIFGSATIFGIFWYFLILLVSGFQRDKVYILLEPDGHVYEDGAGAAHVRQRRAQNARRWGVFGIFMVLISVFSLFLVIMATAVLTDRYVDELNAAYPEFGIFDSDVDPERIDTNTVDNIEIAVVAIVILFSLSLSGIIIGATMAFTGYMQASIYQVRVAPLPYLR